MDSQLIYTVVNAVIGIIGFLIRQHIVDIKTEVKEIRKQTTLTNGRVSVLEAETRNQKDSIDNATKKIDSMWKGWS